ncbi:MAG: RsmG family class I SAM-dependent methyltransferase [Pseudobdellovibrio sp.]
MSFEQRIPLFLQLGFSSEAIPKLKAYIDLLWAANEDLNLISRKMTFDELIDNHLIDCLLPLKLFPSGIKTVADFGSGGGLPGVVYALQFPNITFRLYEKSNMKQDFLKKCKTLAPNLKIQGDIPIELIGIDLIIARAFKPIDVILDISRTYYKNHGKYFLLKGRLEKITEEIQLAQKKFKDANFKIEKINSPILEVERHIVFINF